MNTNECARLAGAINLLRPEWPTDSLRTFIARNFGNRPYQDAALALAYVATDPVSQTPARVLEPGPWWKLGNVHPEPRRPTHCARCRGFHQPHEPHDPPRATPDRQAGRIAQLRQARAEAAAGLCSHGVKRHACADHREQAEVGT